jgi:sugar/nucleoside kinase (ribokinase family)
MRVRPLAVIGLVSLDRVDGGLPRLGGAPYYAARALRLLAHPAVVVTKLAAEDRGRGLHALGVPVVSRPAARTISFRIENERDGRRTLELEELGEPWTPEEACGWVGEAVAHSDWVHAGALTRADFPPAALAELRRGRRLSLDGQALVRPARTGPVELDGDYDPAVLRHVDVLKLSQEEADGLGLELDERSLASLGVREVVVTLGSNGCVVFADGLAEYVRARPLDVPDPTGAGDEFIAAYLSYRRRRHSAPGAARLATEVVHRLLTAHAQSSLNSPRATRTAEPPTSTRSMLSPDPSTRA